MPKHSRGPWKRHDDETYTEILDKEGWLVADVFLEPKLPYDPFCKEGNANADLIAAAPDMYEALKELFKLLEGDKAPKWRAIAFYDIAKKALAKAEGKEENERL